MKIGFIGCGNMAKSIIEGVIAAGITDTNQIYCSEKNEQMLNEYCLKKQICPCTTNMQTVQSSEVILLCVKPQVLPAVLAEIKESADVENKLFISIAAGKTIAFMEEFLGECKLIRVMPNLNAAIGMSESAVCANRYCDERDLQTATKIFESIGNVYLLDEKDFSAFSAVACCSPAFSFMYIDALAKAGVEKGLPAEVAFRCAANSVKASAQMLFNSDVGAEELVRRVCSPGGTTIEGVKKLEEKGFQAAVNSAVTASYNKDKIL